MSSCLIKFLLHKVDIGSNCKVLKPLPLAVEKGNKILQTSKTLKQKQSPGQGYVNFFLKEISALFILTDFFSFFFSFSPIKMMRLKNTETTSFLGLRRIRL